MPINNKTRSSLKSTMLSVAAAATIVITMVLPSNAQAQDYHSHDDVLINIGFHQTHHYKKKSYGRVYKGKRHFNNHRSRKSFKSKSYRKNYYNGYGNKRYGGKIYGGKRYYNNGSYNKGYYKKNYYNGGGSKSYRNNYCPYDGYSKHYKKDSGCYKHKGHYHCD